MLHKTEGICLHYIKYKNHSIIARIFTKNFGLQSYIINSIRTVKPKFNVALFQPLSLLEMVVYHKEGKETLQRLAEARFLYIFQQIPFTFSKSALTMIISEILSKVLHGEYQNVPLFEFLKSTIIEIDTTRLSNDFLIKFLLKLLQHLGIWNGKVEELFKHLYESKYIPAQAYQKEMHALQQLWENKPFLLEDSLKSYITDCILHYYRIHFEHFGDIKSLKILRQL